MGKVITLLVLGFIGWYWSHSQKLKQIALRASVKRCNDAGVQLLDHSVVLQRIAFRKNPSNRWKMVREYRFEFTSTGESRYIGRIILQGKYIVSSELEPYSLN